jgi:hypothetical protein
MWLSIEEVGKPEQWPCCRMPYLKKEPQIAISQWFSAAASFRIQTEVNPQG